MNASSLSPILDLCTLSLSSRRAIQPAGAADASLCSPVAVSTSLAVYSNRSCPAVLPSQHPMDHVGLLCPLGSGNLRLQSDLAVLATTHGAHVQYAVGRAKAGAAGGVSCPGLFVIHYPVRFLPLLLRPRPPWFPVVLLRCSRHTSVPTRGHTLYCTHARPRPVPSSAV